MDSTDDQAVQVLTRICRAHRELAAKKDLESQSMRHLLASQDEDIDSLRDCLATVRKRCARDTRELKSSLTACQHEVRCSAVHPM
jgi:hypothetical protein